jgi:Zn-dependent protease
MSSVPPPEDPPQYQPFQQYYEPQPPAPQPSPQRREGPLAQLGALLLLILKGKTLLTLLISLGAYVWLLGSFWTALGLVVMIFVHEMGHVVEIRRQGMKASAPLFIPFLGAAIFMRQHATDALKQAQIGIAGPIAGTIGATAAFVLYGSTHNQILLFWAYLGFFINLFNLIPVGMLDGGWILAVVSKWFQLFGLAVLIGAVFFIGFSPIVLIVALLGIPAVIERFRNDQLPYYQSVPVPARLAMGAAWLLLTGYLGYAALQSHTILNTLVR